MTRVIWRVGAAAVLVASLAACAGAGDGEVEAREPARVAAGAADPAIVADPTVTPALPTQAAPAAPAAQAAQARDTAVFAGGCFWCMEPVFDSIPGVLSTVSGYTGGTVANPTYEQVSTGRTGHAEVVRVVYDPSRASYARLLAAFWRNIDPLTANAQFCDQGPQYRSAVFYDGAAQRQAADSSKRALQARFREPIVTEITQLGAFYPAEDYHQDYYRTNSVRYKFYSTACGRAARLRQLWGG